ncbi:ankyrin repeat domain-containing protein [Mesoterricola silvestris]|uniref:Ankyrin repeat domain-containing protein n=1 Tax=Mesoterricola silvestris TaxID=2927979 RepID=A0AA48KAB4_9BACT|nr:ankyrin repeat domain-containing protein [Mesoterricola silvestris]BDU71348.1 hypothetical protein METEAL_05220 [Mesoterricola silvestris]
MKCAPIILTCLSCALLNAQAIDSSKQEGIVQTMDDGTRPVRSAKLPALSFYGEVIQYLLDGNDAMPPNVVSWQRRGDPPALNWFLQVHIAPALTGDETLLTLQEMTDGTAAMIVLVPRGGINFWYQMSEPCLTGQTLIVEETAKRLAFVRIRLTEMEFPDVRRMIRDFKELKAQFFFSDPKAMVLDGISYSFKGRAPSWNFDVHTDNPDPDNPLAKWADDCHSVIWKLVNEDPVHGMKGHPITSVDKDCIGPVLLRASAGSGNVDDVRQLLKLSVPVNGVDYWDGRTALLSAAQSYELDVVKILLEAGADPRAVNLNGESAIRLLPDEYGPGFRTGKTELPEWSRAYVQRAEKRTKVAELLKRAGTPIDDVDGDGLTPLMVAIQRQDIQLAKWLVENGADPKKKDKAGKTALDHAHESKDPKVLASLQGIL